MVRKLNPAMSSISNDRFVFLSEELRIQAELIPWDSDTFGQKVAAITDISVLGNDVLPKIPKEFISWVSDNQIKLISCRLPASSLREVFILESFEFKFVEMVLHPFLENIETFSEFDENYTTVEATTSDFSEFEKTAETAFGYERFHVDPRIENSVANSRYRNWITKLSQFPDQSALKILDPSGLTAGFVVYSVSNNSEANWLLTALSANHRGRGIGKFAWSSVIRFHQSQGLKSIKTTVAARNSPVLKLYGKLGFSYLQPSITLHWVSPTFSVPNISDNYS